jgi:hypothetical protein
MIRLLGIIKEQHLQKLEDIMKQIKCFDKVLEIDPKDGVFMGIIRELYLIILEDLKKQ